MKFRMTLSVSDSIILTMAPVSIEYRQRQYLFLYDEIVDHLMDDLVNGEGLNTPLLDGEERVQEE